MLVYADTYKPIFLWCMAKEKKIKQTSNFNKDITEILLKVALNTITNHLILIRLIEM